MRFLRRANWRPGGEYQRVGFGSVQPFHRRCASAMGCGVLTGRRKLSLLCATGGMEDFMANSKRQTVKPNKSRALTRIADPESTDGRKAKKMMSKLRVGLIASDTSPRDIRDLLEMVGEVGEVS